MELCSKCADKSCTGYDSRITECEDFRAETNADKIRSMTDEELAEWIFRNQMFIFKSVCDAFGYTEYDEKEMTHWENIIAWLKQEAE